MRARAKLVKGIRSRRDFADVNAFIDNKIKYDQRFFQKGYAEYQQFMSDVRKQILLNEQVIRIKDRIRVLQVRLAEKNQAMLSNLSNFSGSRELLNDEFQSQNKLPRYSTMKTMSLN